MGYRPGRKAATAIHAMLAGAGRIDDVDVLRAGATGRVVGHEVAAPSRVGTWLRELTFGHVRQLDRLAEAMLARAWAAGAGPGDDPLVVDVDSTVCEVHGYAKQGAAYGYTRQRGYHPVLATRADTGEVVHARQRKGSANTARGAQRFVRETIGRIRRAGATGPITLRVDSGYWSRKVIAACQAHDVRFSLTVRNTHSVRPGHRRDRRNLLGSHRLHRRRVRPGPRGRRGRPPADRTPHQDRSPRPAAVH